MGDTKSGCYIYPDFRPGRVSLKTTPCRSGFLLGYRLFWRFRCQGRITRQGKEIRPGLKEVRVTHRPALFRGPRGDPPGRSVDNPLFHSDPRAPHQTEGSQNPQAMTEWVGVGEICSPITERSAAV